MAYSATMKAGGGAITRDALQQLLSMTDIPRDSISRILMTAETGGAGGILTQRDFNLALAMAAMAQKNMSPTLESVAFHKDDLPVPDITGLQEFAAKAAAAIGGGVAASASAAFPGDSGDPWSNVTKVASTAATAVSKSAMGGVGAVTAAMGAVAVSDPAVAGSDGALLGKKERSAESNGRVSVSSGGNNAVVSVPTINMESVQWQLDLEDVKIQESAEKGGLVFKHTNYEVSTRSFGAMVVRRYNDFFWISNYLVKRYPYRILPNIPPKGFP
ncbi:Sorting nexin mvp1, partial [Linderina macrospora]